MPYQLKTIECGLPSACLLGWCQIRARDEAPPCFCCDCQGGDSMPDHDGPLQLGERAPNVVLDAITREGKIAIDDFRGEKPVLVGLYRGLHCPFCRRHIATLSKLTPALNAKGIENLTVVNTPVERARLYLRYHPMVDLLAASDPERASHRAFGLPNIQ